jgi:hypothetical protein
MPCEPEQLDFAASYSAQFGLLEHVLWTGPGKQKLLSSLSFR